MTLFGAYEPAGLMYLARGIAQGDLQWDVDLAEVLYSCTLCGYCEDLCRRGYRHTPSVSILEELRRIIPENLKPLALRKAADSTLVPKNHKLSVLEQYGIKDVATAGAVDTIIFADNTILHNSAKLSEIGFLLKKSGTPIGCFISQPLPPVEEILLSAGRQDVLAGCIKAIDAHLKKFGIKRVICYSPESLSVLKRFSKSGARFEPIARVYTEMLNKKAPKKLKLPPVTYQDPCHLGRYAGEYVVPREVINRLGLNLKEMWRSHADSLCCGAGGGLLMVNQKLARRYAQNRWKEAVATGARVLITACPYCTANFMQSRPKDFAVLDLTSVVAQAYGYNGKEAAR